MKRYALPFGVGLALLFGGAAFQRGPIHLGAPLNAQAQPHVQGGVDPLLTLSERFEAIASRVTPAVVAVEAVKPAKANGAPKGKPVEESGSGVVVKVEG